MIDLKLLCFCLCFSGTSISAQSFPENSGSMVARTRKESFPHGSIRSVSPFTCAINTPFLSENALFYSPFLKREVTEKFAFRASPYILTFRCLCNNNFVRICCEYSFFLLVSDEYFYFEFRMCTFYGYFHCVAVFHCFYGEYIVSVDIRNFCLGCVF